MLKAPLEPDIVAVFITTGVAYANVDDPTTIPFEASESLVPWSSVIAGPPMDKVVPSTTTAVLPSGVNVSPAAVSAAMSLLALLLFAVARGMVDVPTMRDPAALME